MTGHIQHLSFESLVKMGHFQKEPPLSLKGTTGAKGSEIPVRLKSALGQKQTFAPQKVMSALPPKADMCSARADVRFVPIADIPVLFDHLVSPGHGGLRNLQ